jgi:hypothetical protein
MPAAARGAATTAKLTISVVVRGPSAKHRPAAGSTWPCESGCQVPRHG